MTYAVFVKPINKIRAFFATEKLAQEHADFINKYSHEFTHRGPVHAEVLTILDEKDKEKAGHD